MGSLPLVRGVLTGAPANPALVGSLEFHTCIILSMSSAFICFSVVT